MSSSRRAIYLRTAKDAVDLLSRDEVAVAWDQPSTLGDMTVADLAGHLARSGVLIVEDRIDAPPPDGPSITAMQYYLDMPGLADHDSENNRGIRDRAAAVASVGHPALMDQVTACWQRLDETLQRVPDDRLVLASNRVLVLDRYLATRLLELVVHIDDLAASVAIEPPVLAYAARSGAIALLVDIARHRHGDFAVLRALCRRERDTVDALRVL